MIPDNPNIRTIDATNRHLVSAFKYPDSKTSTDELTDWELGGVAIQDPSLGLEYQEWKGYWDPSDEKAYLLAENSTTPVELFTQSDVVEFSFTFDANMRWSTVTRTSDNVAHHRWYDAFAADYVETSYAGTVSARLCLDDKRALQVSRGAPDMILTYLNSSGQVCWRIQRERFLTQYIHPSPVSGGGLMRISGFGLNQFNRLQWRISPRNRDA